MVVNRRQPCCTANIVKLEHIPYANILPVPGEPAEPAQRERRLSEAETEFNVGHFNSEQRMRTWLAELVAERPALQDLQGN